VPLAIVEAGRFSLGGITPPVGLAESTFLLTAAGLLCIVNWLAAQTRLASAMFGTALLVLATFGMVALPVSAAGALFLAFAAGALCMEVVAFPGTGLHAFGGGVGLALAGLFLTGEGSGAHPTVVLPAAVVIAAATYVSGRRSWRCIRNRPLDPSNEMTGRHTVVLSSEGSMGHGVIAGELYKLRAAEGFLEPGQSVEVIGTEPEGLVVEPSSNVDFS